jgi:hypothetical protein
VGFPSRSRLIAFIASSRLWICWEIVVAASTEVVCEGVLLPSALEDMMAPERGELDGVMELVVYTVVYGGWRNPPSVHLLSNPCAHIYPNLLSTSTTVKRAQASSRGR